jgi:hypothetical protein
LDTFIKALIQDKHKFIKMGVIKKSKAHALVAHVCSSSQNQKYKVKGKPKLREKSKKEWYSKPFNDSWRSKSGKQLKGNRCTYRNRGFHLESTCMKKKIDLMVHSLQKNNLREQIPKETLLGICYILFTITLSVFYVAPDAKGGWRGETPPLCRGSGAAPPRICFFLEKHVILFPHFQCWLYFQVHCWEVF